MRKLLSSLVIIGGITVSVPLRGLDMRKHEKLEQAALDILESFQSPCGD